MLACIALFLLFYVMNCLNGRLNLCLDWFIVKIEECDYCKIKEWTYILYQKGKWCFILLSHYFHYALVIFLVGLAWNFTKYAMPWEILVDDALVEFSLKKGGLYSCYEIFLSQWLVFCLIKQLCEWNTWVEWWEWIYVEWLHKARGLVNLVYHTCGKPPRNKEIWDVKCWEASSAATWQYGLCLDHIGCNNLARWTVGGRGW